MDLQELEEVEEGDLVAGRKGLREVLARFDFRTNKNVFVCRTDD